MPKFLTYQRPTPINKAGWGGRSGTNPYLPIRRFGTPGPQAASRLPALTAGGLPESKVR